MFFLSSIVLMSGLVFVLKGQDFCEQYEANNFTALVYSADNRNLFVIIDKYFWIIYENDSQLAFIKSDRQAFGWNKVLGNRMTTLFSAKYEYEFEIPHQVFVFYDVSLLSDCKIIIRYLKLKNEWTDPFNINISAELGWMSFNGNHFLAHCDKGQFTPYYLSNSFINQTILCGFELFNGDIHDFGLKNSVSFPLRETKQSNDSVFNVFIVQSTDRQLFYIETKIIYENEFFHIELSKYETPVEIKLRFDKIKDIDTSLQLVGLFLTEYSDRLYLFFKVNAAIKYCDIEDVRHSLIKCLLLLYIEVFKQ